MSKTDDTIRLYVAPGVTTAASSTPPTTLPREGAPTEKLHSGLWATLSIEKLQSQLLEMQSKIEKALETLATTSTGSMKLDEVTVGLTISVEGDIGIASAGAEASIELTFKVK